MRLREIDFLRGIAVILVLFRHYEFFSPLYHAGWIGVDLFFVLSGFLVSGLLFKEYHKFGKISGGQFLIRRGFKIYPLFYCALLVTLLAQSVIGEYSKLYKWVGELVFLQNYFGNIWNHTWSLAVEEHFYFGLTLAVFLLIRFQLIKKPKIVLGSFIGVLMLILGLRLYNAQALPISLETHFFPTHLRVDSLLFGVILAWLFHFRNEYFISFFSKQRILLYGVSLVLILPAFFLAELSFWMVTFGFSSLYLGFGLLLGLTISDQNINTKLDRIFSSLLVNGVAKVGYYSYSIYLFHMFVIKYGLEPLNLKLPYRLEFVVYFIVSILLGILMTKLIEAPFLKIRDRIVPRRAKVFTDPKNEVKTKITS